MQNMVQVRKKNKYFVTALLFEFFEKYFGALGVESPPRWGRWLGFVVALITRNLP